jgi:hypothetical protein
VDTPGAPRPKGSLTRWLVVADAPLAEYSEAALSRRMKNLDWISRRALAHEAVVESFMDAAALVPMKLFTLFTTDERAMADVRRQSRRVDAILARVAGRREWGVRVTLDGLAQAPRPSRASGARSGTGYLAAKKAERDALVDRAERSRALVRDLYDRLAHAADRATRRAAVERLAGRGPLLLDAAFLVPRAGERRFMVATGRETRRLARLGYGVKTTGPWPPYSFIEE